MALALRVPIILFLASGTSLLTEAAQTSKGARDSPSFLSFRAEHGRTYSEGTSQYEMRRNLYEHRLQQVELHNSKPTRRWNAAVNHLSDRTEAELAQLRGLRIVASAKSGRRLRGAVGAHSQFLAQMQNSVVPDEKSWDHLKAVKLDFDQAACGSCWAIAAATMLTANAEITGHNRSFSAQELVSCTPNPHNCGGSGGCDGATVELAMNWVMEQGLETSEATPYLGENSVCTKKPATTFLSQKVAFGGDAFDDMIAVGFHGAKGQDSGSVALGLHGWERLPENQYAPLIRALAETGPVAVSVGASGWSAYSSGLFDGCEKDITVNHAVTLIGYGSDKKEKYWKIKNSWGLTWGEDGNIRLLREEGNVHCGTDYKPKDGTACDGGPSTVPVCGMCGILYDSVVPHFQKL